MIFRTACLALAVGLLASGCTATGAGSSLQSAPVIPETLRPAATEEQWQAVFLGGNKLGHRLLRRWRQVDDFFTEEVLAVTLEQPGAAARHSETTLVYRESSGAEPLSVAKQLSGDSISQSMEARVENGQFVLRRDQQEAAVVFDLPEGMLMPEGVRQALLGQAGELRQLEYRSWNFSRQRFDDIELRAEGLDADDIHRWRQRRPMLAEMPVAMRWYLQRRNLSDSPVTVTDVFADAEFHSLAEFSDSAGQELAIVSCTRACAEAEFSPVTHVYRQLVPSPYRISDAALAGKIRYTLTGDFDLVLPATFEQRVKKVSGGVEVTVCGDCGDEAVATSGALQRALQSNYWLAAAHPEIRTAAAERLPERELSARAIMQRLSHFVEERISVASYAGYATALEGLRNGEGDCTEHALLLAALGRAAGVPTRVVVGLAYNNERFLGRRYVFVPHAWVQAWTGARWESFDSGLGKFNAGYIALALSDGEQSEMMRVNAQLHQIAVKSAVQLLSR